MEVAAVPAQNPVYPGIVTMIPVERDLFLKVSFLAKVPRGVATVWNKCYIEIT